MRDIVGLLRDELLVLRKQRSIWFLFAAAIVYAIGMSYTAWQELLQTMEYLPELFETMVFPQLIGVSLLSTTIMVDFVTSFVGVLIVSREYSYGTAQIRQIRSGNTPVILAKATAMVVFCVCLTLGSLVTGVVAQIVWNKAYPAFALGVQGGFYLSLAQKAVTCFYMTYVAGLVGMLIACLLRRTMYALPVSFIVVRLMHWLTLVVYLPSYTFRDAVLETVYSKQVVPFISVGWVLLACVSALCFLVVALILTSSLRIPPGRRLSRFIPFGIASGVTFDD